MSVVSCRIYPKPMVMDTLTYVVRQKNHSCAGSVLSNLGKDRELTWQIEHLHKLFPERYQLKY